MLDGVPDGGGRLAGVGQDAGGDEELVRRFVADFAHTTFREPEGQIKFPYLVPGGFYQQAGNFF